MIARLGTLAITNYEDLDGFAVSRNMPDLGLLPLERLANFVYWYYTRNGTQEDVQKFRAQLWMPPKGQEAHEKSPWAPKNEAAAFQALKAAATGASSKPK